MTDNQEPILTDSSTYLWISLRIGVLVAVAEIPLLFFNVIPVAHVFIGGWLLIWGYTFYRVWRLNTRSLVVNDVGLAKLIAGLFVLGLSTVLLYLGIKTSHGPASDDIIWRIKGAFAGNGLVALSAATLGIFGGFVVEKVRTVLSSLKD